MSKPRILYFIHCYESHAGVENHMRDLASGIGDRFEVSIAFPTNGDSITVVRPGYGRLTFAADTPIWPLTPYRLPITEKSIARLVDVIKPDVCHVQHFLHWPLSLYDQLRSFKLPIVASYHDYYAITPHLTMENVGNPVDTISKEYSLRIFGQDISQYLAERRRILTQSIEKLSVCAVNSPFLERTMKCVFPREYRIVEYGIEPFSVTRRPASGDLRFGYLGNLTPQKGWDIAVDAFEKAHAEYPGTELHLYGWHGNAKIRPGPGIFYHGVYDSSALAEILAGIDVAIIPSRFAESYSIVLSELWMAGIPPVVSDIGAMGERVKDGVNGKKFPASDAAALCNVLCWFLTNNDWKTWSFPRPRTIPQMADEYNRLYCELM